MKTYIEISKAVEAYHNCVKSNNQLWSPRWRDLVESIVKDRFPSGSGFDSGTKIDIDGSDSDKLVFTTAFHHMNDNGMYGGWTEHVITATGNLAHGFTLKISGRNRGDIKSYIHECFSEALNSDCSDAYGEWQKVIPEERKTELA